MKRFVLGIVFPLLLAAFISAPGTAANAQEKVTLRMAVWLPPLHHLSKSLVAWSAQIEEASNGTLLIKLDSAALAKPPGQYDLAKKGVADLAYHVFGYTPGRFQIIRATELPFLSPNAEVGSQATWDWYERNVGADKEMPDVKLITLWIHGPGLIHTKNEIKTLEDLQGVKLRVGGGGVAMSEALGAVPVPMSATQAHESLLRGTTDGTMFPWESVSGFRLTDLVTYHLEVPGGLYSTPFALVMNQKAFDELSPEHQAILDEFGGINGAKFIGRRWDEADAVGRNAAESNGNTIQTIADDELGRLRSKVAFMEGVWLKDAKALGFDGEALLADLRATIERFASTN